MALLSPRLLHVVTRADLATLLTPTYAAGMSVDDEEAHDRLSRALADRELLEDLYQGLSDALVAQQGVRTSVDALMDQLSKRIQARKGRVKEAPATPGISALLVRVNLLLGLASEAMQAAMASAKGKAALGQGLRELTAHLVREVLR